MGKIKQIEYWIKTATDDLTTAELLISHKKFLHGLFFCHLCIEKMIKAHIVRFTAEVPPKSHKLGYLLELTDLELTEEDRDFCALLMIYQLEGRYPENYPDVPSQMAANKILDQTKRFHQWLREKL